METFFPSLGVSFSPSLGRGHVVLYMPKNIHQRLNMKWAAASCWAPYSLQFQHVAPLPAVTRKTWTQALARILPPLEGFAVLLPRVQGGTPERWAKDVLPKDSIPWVSRPQTVLDGCVHVCRYRDVIYIHSNFLK